MNNTAAVTAKENLRVQKWVTILALVLFVFKFVAFYITHSAAILTDALESIVNVIAGFVSLYSLYVALKPRDINHPYGHGKAEFISAAVEGTLISVAGIFIIYESINRLLIPQSVTSVDIGIWLISITAILNYMVGLYCIKVGRKNRSVALIASGRHLQSDAYSTAGIILGLFLFIVLDIWWIDSAVALLFGGIILYTGYKILRSSIAGIMDEADVELLNSLVTLLQQNRQENWVDMHNLRVIKYGSVLHIDCHITVPWYFSVKQAHEEIEKLNALVIQAYGESVELFVHTDPCLPSQCKLCYKEDCLYRQEAFVKGQEWSLSNILANEKHLAS